MGKPTKPARLPRNQMKHRIAPGIWQDMEGNIHWSIPELLELADMPDTPENQQFIREMMTALFRKHSPQTNIIHREKPD